MRLNGPGNWLDVVGKEEDSMITPIQKTREMELLFTKLCNMGKKKNLEDKITNSFRKNLLNSISTTFRWKCAGRS